MVKRLLFLLFLTAPMVLFGQIRTISGVVKDSGDGSTIPGANVLIDGTTKGVATDIDGAFKIDLLASENILVISFVGYKSQSITIGERTSIEVLLESDAVNLDEIVVIGYGEIRKSDLTGAVSSVKGSDLTKIPSVSPMQSLQGKVAGLQVTSSSGAPGSGPIVRIRGTGTFGNANPIYVVDGVILDDINFLR